MTSRRADKDSAKHAQKEKEKKDHDPYPECDEKCIRIYNNITEKVHIFPPIQQLQFWINLQIYNRYFLMP